MLNRRNVVCCLAVALVASLSACSGSGETRNEVAPAVTSPPPATTVSAEAPAAPLQADITQHSVYFDFDKSDIKSEGQSVISNWASYLTSHPSAQVRVEGNCDERGTREYNIGLGERRANAVTQALEAKGVSAAQLTAISYGKERPVALGHDEASWAKNRRADIVQK